MLGDGNMPLPGGACPVDHEAEGPPRQVDMVPAFFHEGPSEVAMEVCHFLQAVAIIDLTPASGHYALEAVKHRIPYTGVCLTESHKDELTKRLVSLTVTSMCDSNNKLFDAAFAEHLKEVAAADGEIDEGPDNSAPGPGGKGGRNGKGRGKGGRGKGGRNQPDAQPDARAALLDQIRNAVGDNNEAGQWGPPGASE